MTSRLQVIIFISGAIHCAGECYPRNVTRTKDITRYPGSDRRILERLYNAASDRAAVAEKVRDEAHDLDKEKPSPALTPSLSLNPPSLSQ